MTTKELEDMRNRALSCFNNALNDSEKLLGGKTDICKKTQILNIQFYLSQCLAYVNILDNYDTDLKIFTETWEEIQKNIDTINKAIELIYHL